MKLSFATILPWLRLASTTSLRFKPESGTVTGAKVDALPIGFDLAASQRPTNTSTPGSFWVSSFIHGSDGHSYMVISHTLVETTFLYYRASVVDINAPSNYRQFTHVLNQSSVIEAANSGSIYNFTFKDYGLSPTSATDPVSQFRTWSTVPGVEFDLTFNTSAPVLLNGGLGSFPGSGMTTYEWSMPAGQTIGSLVIDGTKVSVDSSRSFTWYDRQWEVTSGSSGEAGGFGLGNWTWFELHLETAVKEARDVKMSVWVMDSPSGNKRFATIREGPGLHEVQAVSFAVSSDRTYVSNSTGVVYPLDWTLDFQDGTRLSISSIWPDQELHTADGENPTYEGFITVHGKYKGCGKVTGYGLVEIMPATF